MFELKEDSAFKQHLRDFLVQTKSFADKNNADLFAEEAAVQREVRPCDVLRHEAAWFVCRKRSTQLATQLDQGCYSSARSLGQILWPSCSVILLESDDRCEL